MSTGLGRERSVAGRRWALAGVTTVCALASAQQSLDAPGSPAHWPVPPSFEAPPEAPKAEPSSGGGCHAGQQVPNVYLHSGEFHLSAVDLRIAGRGLDFVWARKYRSRLGPNTAQGIAWDFSYNVWIELEGTAVRLHDGNTRRDLYFPRPGGTYTARQFFREGRFALDGTFTLTFADGGTWNFHALDASPAAGKLESSVDRNGNALIFQYDGLGRLVQVTDTLNRAITVAYDASGRIQSVTDFTGRSVTYAYYGAAEAGGSPGDLKSVTTPPVAGFALGKTTTYTYSKGFADARLNHNLLTVTDPKGQTWLVNTYSPVQQPKTLPFDRLVRMRRGNPGEDVKIETELVSLSPVSAGPLLVIVNDRVGNVMECSFDRLGRMIQQREYTGRANPAQPTTSTTNRPTNKLRADDPSYFDTFHEYNADSLIARTVHPEGNVTERTHELELDPNAPWRTRGNLRELRRSPGAHVPAGDQSELIELFEYATGLGGCCSVSFVDRHVDARGNETLHTYDTNGNRLHTQHRIPSVVEDWEYDAFGQVTAHVLPDNGSAHRRRDEYRYYGPGDGAQNGYLKEVVVDAPNLALTTRYEYDSVGHVVRKIDPRGNDTLYTVNALDQVVSERSPPIAGQRIETLSTYDANDNLVQRDVENRNENGVLRANTHVTTSWLYGILNERTRETREVDAASSLATEYAYDANRNQTLVRKGEAVAGIQPANTLTTQYDERDLVYRVIRAAGDPGQSTDQVDYDRNGNRRAEREGLEDGAHVTTYVHDGFDRLVSTSDPMGNLTEHHYDPNGNRGGRVGDDASAVHPFATRVTGQLLDSSATQGTVRLREEQYTYDALDRVIQRDLRHFDAQTQAAIEDGQSTTTLTWTANSDVESRSGDGAGQLTTYEYDTASRLRLETDPKTNTAQYTYDAAGNVVQLLETERRDLGGAPQAFTHTFSYDALDRRTTQVDGVGNVWTKKYDSRGNRVVDRDPLGHDTRYTYDGLDRLIVAARDMNDNGSFVEGVDVILQQAWDRSSRRTSGTDDRGNATRYAYDALDRLIVTQMADGTIEQIGTGATWILGQTSPNLSGFTSGYDAHDSVEVRRDAAGSTVTSTYDSLDRLVARSIARGLNVLGTTSETYQYDGLSRVITAEDNDSFVSRGSVSTSGYDSLDNVLRETQRILGVPVRTVTAAYDGDGGQTLLVYPGGRAIARTYDVLDRPSLVREDPAGPGTAIATYWYVGPERLERRDYGNNVRLTPTYDGIDGVPNAPGDFGVRSVARTLHKRTGLGGPETDDRTNLWDRAGNRTQVQTPSPAETRTYGYDALDRLVTSSVAPGGPALTYVLDGAGNRTSVSGGPDPGSYVAGAVNAYSSTPFDTRTHDPNGNLFSQTSPTRNYRYDYRDRLVQYTNTGTGQTSTYRYDCLGRRIERNVGGTITRHYYDGGEEIEEQNGSNATVATWVYSKGLDSRLQMQRSGHSYYYHEDDLASVRKVTDASGVVVDSVAYDDFGTPTVTSAGPPVLLVQAPNQVAAQDSDLDGGSGSYSFVQAEDFTTPQSGSVSLVRWWGTYDGSPPASDDFWIQIRLDSGGLPGALLAQRHPGNSVARTPTGQLIGGFYNEYRYQAAISPAISLSAGTSYWLVVFANTVGYPGSWRWEQSSAGNGSSAYDYDSFGWSTSFADLAYEMEITTGPPASENPFLFMGRRWEAASGLATLGDREHESRAGRFTERDDVEWWRTRGQQGNAYTFATNNPVSLVDYTDSLASSLIEDDKRDDDRTPLLRGMPELPRPKTYKEGRFCSGICFGSELEYAVIGDKPMRFYAPKVLDAAQESVREDLDLMAFVFKPKAKAKADYMCFEYSDDRTCTCSGEFKPMLDLMDHRWPREVLYDSGWELVPTPLATIRYGFEYMGECVP